MYTSNIKRRRRNAVTFYLLHYRSWVIPTIRSEAQWLDLMKMIERDRFAFDRMLDDLTIESRLASDERIMPMTAQLVEF